MSPLFGPTKSAFLIPFSKSEIWMIEKNRQWDCRQSQPWTKMTLWPLTLASQPFPLASEDSPAIDSLRRICLLAKWTYLSSKDSPTIAIRLHIHCSARSASLASVDSASVVLQRRVRLSARRASLSSTDSERTERRLYSRAAESSLSLWAAVFYMGYMDKNNVLSHLGMFRE